MTNNRIILADDNIAHDPLPADADALALMLDILDTAPANIAHSLRYARDRFDMISDYDDYIPADTRILAATCSIFFAHIHDTPRDALLELIADRDFIIDLMISDSTYAIHAALNIDFYDD